LCLGLVRVWARSIVFQKVVEDASRYNPETCFKPKVDGHSVLQTYPVSIQDKKGVTMRTYISCSNNKAFSTLSNIDRAWLKWPIE
jgi:hypothetical protein